IGSPIGSPIRASISRDDARAKALVTAAFSQGSLTLPLVLSGTDFQRQVWRALLQIPLGETISYAQLASRVGKPGAARAVGSAVGANQIGFLVPCHRVVRQDGVIGQFRWGSDVKQRLLEWESRLTHG
ncbi:MAG TPA: methylated-DNA--[protein]-cysteine S-methyltransferase, partial [Orrella sp.]